SVDFAQQLTLRADAERPATGLLLVIDLHARMLVVRQFDRRGCRTSADKIDPAEPMEVIARPRLGGGLDAPSVRCQPDASMSIPGPRFREEHESVAGIPETLLQKRACIGRN